MLEYQAKIRSGTTVVIASVLNRIMARFAALLFASCISRCGIHGIEHTVFLVVADHNSRVYGSELVPISRFHIPGLILGGTIEAGVIDGVASQVDLAPTLLSLIGIDAEHPMIGHDLTRQSEPGRAIMQFNGAQAYMEGEYVTVLQEDLAPRQFLYRDGHLVDEGDYGSELTDKAVAHAAWSSIAYKNSLHRLPDVMR